MGKSRSHSGRSNFNYVLKQLNKSDIFDLFETKNGILIKSKSNNKVNKIPIHKSNKKANKTNKTNKKTINKINNIDNQNNNQDNNQDNYQENNQYIIHTDSKKLHELRRWLKREYGFILDLKN